MPVKQADHKVPLAWLSPLLGLVMAIALGVLAYVLAGDPPGGGPREGVIRWAAANLRQFSGRELPPDQMRWLFTLLLFLVMGAVATAMVALFVPKRKSDVSMTTMQKDRKEFVKSIEVKKERRRRQARFRREP